MNDVSSIHPNAAPADEFKSHPVVHGRSALSRLTGLPESEWMPGGVPPFALMHLAAHSELVHQGSKTRCVYLVQAGHFKIVRTGEDGYEQVLGLVDSDELIGCDGLADGHHASGAVALEESWVYALPVESLQSMVQTFPQFGRRWQAALAKQIARAGELAWVMAAVGSEKRLARFVMLLGRRAAERGESSRRLHLRMGRRDIASHLGLAHESVSRSFTLLAHLGLLAVNNREIEILDSEALQDFASSTRGYPDARRALAAAACAA